MIGIIADRIEQPDARKGFILDGFPRTVPQAEALDRCWPRRACELDAVIELQVDEAALLGRIEKPDRRDQARGEPSRRRQSGSLHQRCRLSRADRAGVDYYRQQGELRTVDGMAPIDDVTAAIEGAEPASRTRVIAASRSDELSGRRPPDRDKRPIGTKSEVGAGKRAGAAVQSGWSAARSGARRRPVASAVGDEVRTRSRYPRLTKRLESINKPTNIQSELKQRCRAAAAGRRWLFTFVAFSGDIRIRWIAAGRPLGIPRLSPHKEN